MKIYKESQRILFRDSKDFLNLNSGLAQSLCGNIEKTEIKLPKLSITDDVISKENATDACVYEDVLQNAYVLYCDSVSMTHNANGFYDNIDVSGDGSYLNPWKNLTYALERILCIKKSICTINKEAKIVLRCKGIFDYPIRASLNSYRPIPYFYMPISIVDTWSGDVGNFSDVLYIMPYEGINRVTFYMEYNSYLPRKAYQYLFSNITGVHFLNCDFVMSSDIEEREIETAAFSTFYIFNYSDDTPTYSTLQFFNCSFVYKSKEEKPYTATKEGTMYEDVFYISNKGTISLKMKDCSFLNSYNIIDEREVPSYSILRDPITFRIKNEGSYSWNILYNITSNTTCEIDTTYEQTCIYISNCENITCNVVASNTVYCNNVCSSLSYATVNIRSRFGIILNIEGLYTDFNISGFAAITNTPSYTYVISSVKNVPCLHVAAYIDCDIEDIFINKNNFNLVLTGACSNVISTNKSVKNIYTPPYADNEDAVPYSYISISNALSIVNVKGYIAIHDCPNFYDIGGYSVSIYNSTGKEVNTIYFYAGRGSIVTKINCGKAAIYNSTVSELICITDNTPIITTYGTPNTVTDVYIENGSVVKHSTFSLLNATTYITNSAIQSCSFTTTISSEKAAGKYFGQAVVFKLSSSSYTELVSESYGNTTAIYIGSDLASILGNAGGFNIFCTNVSLHVSSLLIPVDTFKRIFPINILPTYDALPPTKLNKCSGSFDYKPFLSCTYSYSAYSYNTLSYNGSITYYGIDGCRGIDTLQIEVTTLPNL